MNRNHRLSTANLRLTSYSTPAISQQQSTVSTGTKRPSGFTHLFGTTTSSLADQPSTTAPQRGFTKKASHAKPNSNKIRKLRTEHKDALKNAKPAGYYHSQESRRVFYEGKFTPYTTRTIPTLVLGDSHDDTDAQSRSTYNDDDAIITPKEHAARVKRREQQLFQERARMDAADNASDDTTEATPAKPKAIKAPAQTGPEASLQQGVTAPKPVKQKQNKTTGGEESIDTQLVLSTFDQLRMTGNKFPTLNPSEKLRRVRKRPAIPPSTFLELGINPAILAKLSNLDFKNPTAIQRLVIPYLIRRYNGKSGKLYVPPTIAIQDHTGSGKTLAYGLPIISSIDVKIDSQIPPPNVIAAMHELRGVRVAYPPPLQADPTISDERERPRLIQYNKDHIYTPSADKAHDGHDDQDGAYDDDGDDTDDVTAAQSVNKATRKFLDRLVENVDVFSMTSSEWETHVFEMEQSLGNNATGHQDVHNSADGTQSIRPLRGQDGILNAYSLEAGRLRKKKLLMARLQKIFPFLSKDKLDTDAPQSRLQSIIVVPTKELALQVARSINSVNHTVYMSKTPQTGSHQVYGDHNNHIVPHQGKTTINVRVATGKVNPVLLGSLGVFLHKNSSENSESTPSKTPYNKPSVLQADGDVRDVTKHEQRELDQKNKPHPHPFVQFGKGHGLYRADQEEYRKAQMEKERQEVIRKMRLRERQLQGETLSKLEEEELQFLTLKEKSRSFDNDHEVSPSVHGIKDDHDDDDIAGDVIKAASDDEDTRQTEINGQTKFQEMARLMTNQRMEELSRLPDDERRAQQKSIKDRYLQEVSSELLEQIGGEQGDHVEVVREKQPHVIVGTPETIVNLIKSGGIQLPATGPGPNQLKHLVFDEIDHLARNETSPEHYHVLQLLSLPADQCVFVSASMTQTTSQLMTRLARRQDMFVKNPSPKVETVSNLLTLPRPPVVSLTEEEMEAAYSEAFDHAQKKVQIFEKRLETEDVEQVLGSSMKISDPEKLKQVLDDESSKVQIIDEIKQKLYKKNFIPTLPETVFQKNLQESLQKPLGVANRSDQYGEILFLTPEHYRPSRDAQNTEESPTVHDNAVPLPPYLRQFYLPFSYKSSGGKINVLLDLLCQLKVRPLQTKTSERMKLTASAQQLLKAGGTTETNTLTQETTELGESMETLPDPFTKSGPKKKTRRELLFSDGLTSKELCPGSILVFFSPKEEKDMVHVYKQLTDAQLNVGLYCSSSTRDQRRQVLHENDHLDVILTNDSLSRGIDFKHVSMVINVDIPRSTTNFIHRCGRVCRVNGAFRRNSSIVNMVEVPFTPKTKPPQQLDELLKDKSSPIATLNRHCEKVDLTINAWPYEQINGLNFILLRSIKTILAQEKEDEGIRAHVKRRKQEELDTKRRNIKLHKLGVVHVDNHKSGAPDSSSKDDQGGNKVAVQRLKHRVSQHVKGNNTNPWTYASSQRLESDKKFKVLRAK